MNEVSLSRLAVVVASGSRVESNLLHLLEAAIKSELPASRLKLGVALGAAAVLRDTVVWNALVVDAARAGASDTVDAALTAAAEYAADVALIRPSMTRTRGSFNTIRLTLREAFQRDRGQPIEDSALSRCAKVARLIHALCIVRVAQRESAFRPIGKGGDDRAPNASRKPALTGLAAATAPIADAPPRFESRPSLARIQPESASSIMLRALVVSPDGATRRAITRLLAPFEVVDVEGASATIGLLTAYRAFDVVFLDAAVDETAAASLARTIRATWPAIGERIFFIRRDVAVPIDRPETRIPVTRADLVEATNSLRRRTSGR